MKATKAYIASLGTTGVLLAAALLMLAVVSAVVAFDRWPGANVQAPVKTLVLNERPTAIRVSARSLAPSATPAAVRAGRPVAATGPRSVAGPQLVANQRLNGGRPTTTGPAGPAAPAVPAPVQTTVENVQSTTAPLLDAVSNPATTTGAVADGTQAATDAAGAGVTSLSPQLGQTVTQTGQTVAQTVRSLPLPQHILPGH